MCFRAGEIICIQCITNCRCRQTSELSTVFIEFCNADGIVSYINT